MPKFTTFEEEKDALELILEHVLVDRGGFARGRGTGRPRQSNHNYRKNNIK